MGSTDPGGNGDRAVDVVVLKFSGEIVPAVRELIGGGLVPGIELVFIWQGKEVLYGIDTGAAVPIMGKPEPSSSAAVLAVDGAWLAPFISAARNAGGEVIGQSRMPAAMLAAARGSVVAGWAS